MAAFALFAREGCQPGMLHVQEQAQRLKGKEQAEAEVSVHPGSPSAPATLVPFGLMAPGVAGYIASSVPAAHSLQQGCPSCRGLPTWHGLCQAVQQPVGLEGVSAAGCLGSAEAPATQLCPGRGSAWWVHDGKSGSQCRGWEEASCLPQGDSDQPGWQKVPKAAG